MTGGGQSRRAFLGASWREALGITLRGRTGGRPPVVDGTAASAVGGPRTMAAAPATGALALDDVIAEAAEVGLGARAAAIRALARRSARLTPAPAHTATTACRSRLGGTPDFTADLVWPTSGGQPLRFVAQIDLAAVASPAGERVGHLPGAGLLQFFADVDSDARRLEPDPGAGARVLAVSGALAGPPAHEAIPPPVVPACPLELSLEWSLPREWSAAVSALELSDQERDGWHELRAWLARRQGVELHDEVRGLLALHRLFGYPDETRGDMPLACELLSAGALLDHHGPRTHPLARELGARCDRWRLLLQLSVDDRLGWEWGGAADRLYFWIPWDDVDAADFSRVRALAQ